MPPTARLTIRIDLGQERSVGPGKIRLLEVIRETGSISEAGRTLGMSYRRAWLLVNDLNTSFRQPVVTTQHGGVKGGGAAVSDFGIALINDYRAIEQAAHSGSAARLNRLQRASLKSSEPARVKAPRRLLRAPKG